MLSMFIFPSVNPFQDVKAFHKDKCMTFHCTLINNVEARFNNNEGVHMASRLEELALEGLCGNVEVAETTMTEKACTTC